MRNVCLLVLLILISHSALLADSRDTVVFQTAMRTDNEVPVVSAPGTSGSAIITVNATRDVRGNIDSATVVFDIDYTVAIQTTFTGLHIHNAPVGVNGAVVINTGLSAASPITAQAGTGHITRVVNYLSGDPALRFVTGLLAQPELYYVNIHSTTNPGGLMRGPMLPTFLRFRPVMSPQFESPVVNLDAEGAALVEVQVTRNSSTGVITSGVVSFDVDYRFPGAVTITGLHIHNGALGVNGPVVIDSGINATTRAISGVSRGNVFRVAEIDSSNTAGIAALNGLMTDPTQYYINMHTTTNPGGVMRGQLSSNVYTFFNLMNAAEENPPTNTAATANSMTFIRLDRDSTGNVVGGAVSFNVNFSMGGAVTFTGLHIHNGKIGVNGAVVLDSRISAANPVVDDDGNGSISREITVDSSSTQVTLDSLRGVIENPENYYVNIHTTTNPGGIIRAQLARETYHFRTAMSPANEVPPISSNASAIGWLTAKISRDAAGLINGGTVTFDIDHTVNLPTTFTGLHIHHPAPAGVNAGVTINTGLSANNPVDSPTGIGNITRVVTVASTDANGLATLNTLVNNPDQEYVNIHTTTSPGGLMRSQLLPVSTTVAHFAAGADWTTSVLLTNPSTTASVNGELNFVQSSGSPTPETVSDPNRSFWIPAGGSVTMNLNNQGPLTTGVAKIFSNAPVTARVRFQHPLFPSTAQNATVTARAVSLPVSVGSGPLPNSGIAIFAQTAGTLVLSLRDASGTQIAGGSRSIDVTAGQHIVGFVRDLFPAVTTSAFTGTLTITSNATTGTGSISVLALQFDGSITPVTVTALP